MARVHRIGQRNSTTCEFWTAKGTLEETVNAMCRERLALTGRREDADAAAAVAAAGTGGASHGASAAGITIADGEEDDDAEDKDAARPAGTEAHLRYPLRRR
jgi:hypothetical protein